MSAALMNIQRSLQFTTNESLEKAGLVTKKNVDELLGSV